MRDLITLVESQGLPDLSQLSDHDLGAYALEFVEKHAGVRPDYDPEYDDADERWTGPDSALLHAAATSLLQGQKPGRVRSDWGSGTYRGWSNKVLGAEHDALVAEINRRSSLTENHERKFYLREIERPDGAWVWQYGITSVRSADDIRWFAGTFKTAKGASIAAARAQMNPNQRGEFNSAFFKDPIILDRLPLVMGNPFYQG